VVTESRETARRGQRGRRRSAYQAVGFALLGLFALGGVATALARSEVPSPIAGAPTIGVPAGDSVNITWLGDTFLGDGAQPFIDANGMSWLGALLPELEFDDVVIANLEGPITLRSEPFDPMQQWSYDSDPSAAVALAAMGIDAVSLGNNHSMDRGAEGLDDTLANAREAGLVAFGAGMNSGEARLPLLVESERITIAILAFSDDGGLKAASSERAGIRRLSLANIKEDIEAVRLAGVDRVIAAVHWGGNYTAVDARQRQWAEALADEGYDMVIGTGPHVVQPIELVKGMPVAFSIGNYVFGTPGRFNGEAQGFGLVLTTAWRDGEDLSIRVRCIQTDNDLVEFQPRACDSKQAESVLSGVSPLLKISADSATMTVPVRATVD